MQTPSAHLPQSRRTAAPAARRQALVALVALLALVATAVAGCSSGSDSSNLDAGSGEVSENESLTESRADQGAASNLSDAPESEGSGVGSAGGRSSSIVDLDPAVFVGRDVIRTATMTLVNENLDAARSEVATLLTRVGGVIASELTVVAPRRPGVEGVESTMQLSLQVPTARFDQTLAGLDAIGRVSKRSIQSQDVTTQVADVDARVETARVALGRIRALLDQANSLGTVIRLEAKVAARQSDLESLLAQQEALEGQTQSATIQLELRMPEPGKEPAKTEEKAEPGGFVPGLRDGWDALRAMLIVLSTMVGLLLPFAAVVALLAVPVLVWRRRRGAGPITGPIRPDPVGPPAT